MTTYNYLIFLNNLNSVLHHIKQLIMILDCTVIVSLLESILLKSYKYTILIP